MSTKTVIQLRTSEEAVNELEKLHARYKDKPEGERLTIQVIQKAVGVSQAPTISRWFNRHNKPTGPAHLNLCQFLDKAKKKKWLEKFINQNSPKGKR